ncbi:hypothetical protein ADILRU_0244 [Leifsonia rubra CMS 76R]|nr:hypothetical protein ADILRU_0244 [Leifsonia rubra CMS 76R]
MLRIAILTIDGYTNYGNRLQNFALQEALRSLGCDVETVQNSPEPSGMWSLDRIVDAAVKATSSSPSQLAGAVTARLSRRSSNSPLPAVIEQRAAAFEGFSSSKIAYSAAFSLSRSSSRSTQVSLSEAFDHFVVGSDQVWNPFQRHGAASDFLRFAAADKRTAYAASFGVDTIPDRYRARYAKWLGEIPNISVREEKGAELVKDLTGGNAPVVLDPTLLLNAGDWSELATPAAGKPNRPYLLTYFLGHNSPERQEIARRLARERDLEIVSLNSVEDLSAFVAGPREFVDYISTADYVLTDSFHGAVFSILYRRSFTVFAREGGGPSMTSRLQSLLARFGLDKQMHSQGAALVESPDYAAVEEVLTEARSYAFAFLQSSIDSTLGNSPR